jgi:hypothetical protein
MKKITYLLFAVCFFALSFSAKAQCTYTLEMNDSWGDGWSGSTMDVLVNGTVVLDDVGFLDTEGSPAGQVKTVTFSVNDGDDITTVITLDPGDYADEISYSILANNGLNLGSGDAYNDITTGTITAICYTCTPPTASASTVNDCANGLFHIDVNVTNMGSATSLIISNSYDATTVSVPNTGSYSTGSFPIGTPVSVTLEHDVDSQCDVSTALLSDTCPPANDECTGAIAVVCDDVVNGSTAGATDSIGNPSADVWYSYTGSGAVEDITASLCNSGFDTNMRVYDACAGTQIATNDDFCGVNGWRSQVTFTSDGTSTYYILIEGYGSNTGSYEMSVTCEPHVDAPSNDELVSATPLVLGTPLTGQTTAGATQSAGDQPTCELFGFIADVWYSFTAPASGEVTIATTITGSSDQANVVVYNNTSIVEANQEGCSNENGGESLYMTSLIGGNTYYVRVWSDGSTSRRTEGTFDITAVDATLSMADVDAQGFTYFPNPVNHNLSLRAQNAIQNVSVYNMLGQEVLKTAPNTLESEINMSDLSNGAYFVKVTINDVTKTVRIIKQ